MQLTSSPPPIRLGDVGLSLVWGLLSFVSLWRWNCSWRRRCDEDAVGRVGLLFRSLGSTSSCGFLVRHFDDSSAYADKTLLVSLSLALSLSLSLWLLFLWFNLLLVLELPRTSYLLDCLFWCCCGDCGFCCVVDACSLCSPGFNGKWFTLVAGFNQNT